MYARYNRAEFIHPDPLEFLHQYAELKDRELVGIIASSLAYGRVAQILKSVSHILKIMGDSPYYYIKNGSEKQFRTDFFQFKHRFTTGEEFCEFLCGIKKLLKKYGSLESSFSFSLSKEKNYIHALSDFTRSTLHKKNSLLPDAALGSACKRLNLFMRWMVRCDDVDPGGWTVITPADLLIPLDTHMHKICSAIGLCSRKQADMKTVIEITDNFKKIVPDDPVRYDFSMTRFGIRSEISLKDFLEHYEQ